jgi:glycosyltransferase involved in cell wall biosynthesis
MKPSLLWLASHFFHPSGHADEARSFLRALERSGCAPAARHARGRYQQWSNVELTRDDRAMLERQLERSPGSPCVAVHHYVPRPGRDPLPGVVNVARAMFETDRLPDGWARLLKRWDAVWVTSRHNYDVFAQSGVPPSRLRLLTQTIDFDAFRPGTEPYPLDVPSGHVVFLANFDFSERKGWRQLLEAWTLAFDRTDHVCLVLKTGSVARFDARFVREAISEFQRRLPYGPRGPARVRVMAEMLPAASLPRLYAAADVYVSASRGEAWGRPYMEAMSMGLPTIGTRWGGNLDFMDEGNSWLIGGRLVPVADGAQATSDLYRGHRWFEADVEELASVFREVAGDLEAARRKAATARERLIAGFGPELTASHVIGLAREGLAVHGGDGTRDGYDARAYAGSPVTSPRNAATAAGEGSGPPATPTP